MKELVAKLEGLLRLRAIPFGMKLYETVAEMEAIPKIRRPKGSVHTLDQIVAQAARLGWTVGITTDDLVGDQCRAVVGLGAQDEKWYSGQHMVGVWFATPVDASAHQRAMNVVPVGKYKALAVAPLASGRLDPPDIALFYATPGANEMPMALPPEELRKAIEGMEALAKNGFRYPFAQYGIQQDVRAGMAVSYPDRK